ncbi:DUF1552 domain-containing protein, partial [bacterium]|nr:DUF1552 domain-containing protein [bacterium]
MNRSGKGLNRDQVSRAPSRRQFLKAMGLGAGGLLLPSLPAYAKNEGEAPKRFLLFYTAQGAAPQRWVCNPAGRSNDDDWDEDWTTWGDDAFSDSLRPLAPWTGHCSAVSGLGLVSCAADGSGFHHERSKAHGPTGAHALWVGGVPYTGGRTIDQQIAGYLARSDRYLSIECSVAGGLDYDGLGTGIYQGPGQPITPIDDPAELWDRLYGVQDGEADKLTARQDSVLDLVAERYESVSRNLSNEDRRRLESHKDLIRGLERRLAGVLEPGCAESPRIEGHYGDYNVDFEDHLQLVAAAFSCDLARVASIQMGQLETTQLGLPPGDIHKGYAHAIYSDQIAEDAMASYMAYHAEQFVRILEVLDGIQDGDGTLLDNTVVAWFTELADSWHGMDRYPAVLAGGANSGLRLGRYINYARTSPFQTPKPVP